MWSSLDVILGLGFMVAWAVASAVGGAAVLVILGFYLGRRAAA